MRFYFRYCQSNIQQLLPLPTTAEHVMKSLCTVQITKQCSAVVGSREEPPNTWLTVAKKRICRVKIWIRVCMLLKGTVESCPHRQCPMRLNSPLSHGSHIGYDVCTLGMKSWRCVSNLRFAANYAKQRSFQCALMCPCAQITDQKVH